MALVVSPPSAGALAISHQSRKVPGDICVCGDESLSKPYSPLLNPDGRVIRREALRAGGPYHASASFGGSGRNQFGQAKQR